MIIATFKASLVVSFFMGLRWEKGFNRVAFIGSLVFILIFFAFVFADIGFREYRTPIEGKTIEYKSPVVKTHSQKSHEEKSTHH